MSLSVKEQCLAWWQLLRIGNVFTAASNVIAGFLIAQGGWEPMGPLLLLIVTSSLLYTAGMVLNDVFDAKLDAVERPERPIPSGRISRGTAYIVGAMLLATGCLTAAQTANLFGDFRPAITALALAICVVGYDAYLKNTFLGPWTMGTCRLLNVMLGAYGTTESRTTDVLFYAILVGLYTVGVTYFARTENREGLDWNQKTGIALILATTFVVSFWAARIAANSDLMAIHFAILVLWIWGSRRWFTSSLAAPSFLRGRVGRMIQGFIVMDVVVIHAALGWQTAAILLSLLIPTWIASRFAPMT
jgi:4-hydroxybenzoate polyprenyltransferase